MCIAYFVCVAQSKWRKGGQLKGEQIEESSTQNGARCMTSFVRYAYRTDKNDSEGEINWESAINCTLHTPGLSGVPSVRDLGLIQLHPHGA